ncbi:MAG: hypothetical protein ABSG06_09045 [Methanoregula sp.]|jgi:hypothetical protein
MKISLAIILICTCIAVIVSAGCTYSSSQATPSTPTPQIIYVTVTVTPSPTTTHCYWNPQTMSCGEQPFTAPPTTVVATTATTAAPDPILHRWIRQYSNGTGYEFQFYPDGTVIYKLGTIVTINSNLKIPSPTVSGSGTWTSLGNAQYLVKVYYTGNSGAPDIIRAYTLEPQYATLPVHLVSSFEQADVDAATANGTLHASATDIFYLEQAPQDTE